MRTVAQVAGTSISLANRNCWNTPDNCWSVWLRVTPVTQVIFYKEGIPVSASISIKQAHDTEENIREDGNKEVEHMKQPASQNVKKHETNTEIKTMRNRDEWHSNRMTKKRRTEMTNEWYSRNKYLIIDLTVNAGLDCATFAPIFIKASNVVSTIRSSNDLYRKLRGDQVRSLFNMFFFLLPCSISLLV